MLWVAAGLLWILDASINISMEPFRAFVGDQLPAAQRPAGYAMQSFFIGAGSIVASVLPWLFAQAGIANTAAAGVVPDTVKYSFYAGAAVLFGAIAWTVLSTREYPPDALLGFTDATPADDAAAPPAPAPAAGLVWVLAGAVVAAAVWFFGVDKQLYLIAGMIAGYGVIQLIASAMRGGFINDILADLRTMPSTMRQLAVVQFFSWFALFAMWIHATGAVTSVHYGTSDSTSAAYNDGANWVGVLFAAYNGFAAIAAILIPPLTRRLGLRVAHLVNLGLGGLGLLSFLVIRDPYWLIASMVGVGFAWASILSIPYALLSDSVPAKKMGVYMGIFNFFIVIPQLCAASLLGFLLKTFFASAPIGAFAIGGVSLILAGVCTLRVRESA
jgi:maltose/moltooligosaccharide transporter